MVIGCFRNSSMSNHQKICLVEMPNRLSSCSLQREVRLNLFLMAFRQFGLPPKEDNGWEGLLEVFQFMDVSPELSLRKLQFNNFGFLKEKYEDVFVHDEKASRHISSAESLHYALPATGAMNPKVVSPRKLHVRSRHPTQQNIVREITYYKAKDAETENDLEERESIFFKKFIIVIILETVL